MSTEVTSALGRRPAAAWWVPGRIEVLGKHTDYAGGRALTCATDHGLLVAMVPRTDRLVRLHVDGRVLTCDPDALPDALPGSGTYLLAVLRRLTRNFTLRYGADLAVAADLPRAAGMSSSSALLSGLTTALVACNGLSADPLWRSELTTGERVAHYLGCIENGSSCGALAGESGVGTAGGCMDHTAILLSRAGCLTAWRFGPTVREQEVALPTDHVWLVAVSGVEAKKTGAAREAYNAVSQRARQALTAWNAARNRQDLHLGAALAIAGRDGLLAAISDPDLRRRAECFAIESGELVPAATTALGRHDLAGFSAAVAHSMDLAISHLGNQVPETIALVDLARRQGAVAASAFGAGFGGSVWALVRRAEADHFAGEWLAAYRRHHPLPGAQAVICRTEAGGGLTSHQGDEADGSAWVLDRSERDSGSHRPERS